MLTKSHIISEKSSKNQDIKINKKNLEKFVQSISDLNLNQEDQIVFFAYYIQEIEKMNNFGIKEIEICFDEIGISIPTNLSRRLKLLSERKKKRLVKNKKKYKIAYNERKKIDELIKGDMTYHSVSQELHNLPNILSKKAEQEFLKEIIKCYRIKSWRAVIVLMWILTVDHIQDLVLKGKLIKFNSALQTNRKYQKFQVTIKEDFEEIKESDFVTALKTANIITKNQHKILKNKLDDRNSYAHPSSLTISPSKALDFIEDLTKNVISVLK